MSDAQDDLPRDEVSLNPHVQPKAAQQMDAFWNWMGKVPTAFHTLWDYQLARRLICLGRPKWHEHLHDWSKN